MGNPLSSQLEDEISADELLLFQMQVEEEYNPITREDAAEARVKFLAHLNLPTQQAASAK